MKDHVPMKLGPLALLLAVVSICLTVLAILSFSTARADQKLAERYAHTVQTRYALEEQGQRYLETAAANSTHVFEQDNMCLTVVIDAQGVVTDWRFEKLWDQEELIGGLWLPDF